MKYIIVLLLIAVANVAAAQAVNLVGLQQPAGGPVQPGTTTHEVLQFRVYKDTGSAASNITQVSVAVQGSQADWDTVYLYWDVDHSRTFTTGDQQLGSATALVAGKATFSGANQPIQDGFLNGRDYLIIVDIAAGATSGQSLTFNMDAPDISASAGTVSAPLGAVNGNPHVVRIDTGTEMDVSRSSIAIISSATATHDVGFIATSGGNLTFNIANSGSAQLQLNGATLVQVTLQINCVVTVTADPSAAINQSTSSNFTINVDPTNATGFNFRLSIPNSDFDEDPYMVNCAGTAAAVPVMSVEHSSSPVLNGGSVTVGSHTAGVGVNIDFTIFNTGGGPLNLTGTPTVLFPVLNNATAVLQTAPSTPVNQGGGNTTFTVTYTPVGSGNFDFALEIPNNDFPRNPFVIGVSGSAPTVTPTQIGIFREPAGADATVVFSVQPIVAVTNSVGAVDSTHNGTQIQATIKTGTGGTGAVLGGTTTATIVNGYATFADLSINSEATGYVLTFTALASSFGTADSASFDVGPAPPAPPPPAKNDSGGDDGGCSTAQHAGSWLLVLALFALLFVGMRASTTLVGNKS